jgi:hypothetical protein
VQAAVRTQQFQAGLLAAFNEAQQVQCSSHYRVTSLAGAHLTVIFKGLCQGLLGFVIADAGAAVC